MKIITVSMMKNEEAMVESAVRYWMTFSDEVLVFDHGSSDGTPEILQALRGEFPERLTLFHPEFEMGLEKQQDKVINAMLKDAFEERGADLVLPLDADEFPYLEINTGETVREYLSSLDQNLCYSVFWTIFAPPEDDHIDYSRLVPLSYRLKRKTPIRRWQKCIVTGKAYRQDPICVTMGNHEIFRPSGKPVPPVIQLEATLYYAHYKYRSLAHFRYKVANGWIASHSRRDWAPGESEHYHLACEQIMAGQVSREDLEWFTLSESGRTGESKDEIHSCKETIDPLDFFPNLPLRYTERYAHNVGEFALFLRIALDLTEQYRDTRQALEDCRQENTTLKQENTALVKHVLDLEAAAKRLYAMTEHQKAELARLKQTEAAWNEAGPIRRLLGISSSAAEGSL